MKSPKTMDKPSSGAVLEKRAEDLKPKILKFFDQRREAEESQGKRFGASEEAIDYGRVRDALGDISNKRPEDIFDALFNAGVSPDVLQTMAEAEDLKIKDSWGKPYRVRESDIKDRFFSETLITESGIEFKSNGAEWLRDFISAQRSIKK